MITYGRRFIVMPIDDKFCVVDHTLSKHEGNAWTIATISSEAKYRSVHDSQEAADKECAAANDELAAR